MSTRFGKTSEAKRWCLLIGLLCCALLVFAGSLAASHAHAGSSLDHADCGLCATAHVVAQHATLLPVVAALKVSNRTQVYIPAVRPRTLARFALFTRPPPAITES